MNLNILTMLNQIQNNIDNHDQDNYNHYKYVFHQSFDKLTNDNHLHIKNEMINKN